MHHYPNTHFALLLAIGALTQACSLNVIDGPPSKDAGAEGDETDTTQTDASEGDTTNDATVDTSTDSPSTSVNSTNSSGGDASTDGATSDEAGASDSGDADDGSISDAMTESGSTSGTDAGGSSVVINRGNCGADLTNATVVSSVSGDTTWSGTILVESPITIGDVELTIAPGTNIVLAADAGLTFGRYNGDTSTLHADGTEDNPIVICGAEATPGYWREIFVGSLTKSNSTISHVNVFDGGGKDAAAALSLVAALDVNNVTIVNSAGAGLSAEDFGDDSAQLSVLDSKAAIILKAPEAVDRFPLGGQLVGNDDNVAVLTFTTIQTPTTYHDLGIPYLHPETVTLGSDVTLEAGVELLFGPGAEYIVGRYIDDEGTLRVAGTESAPVVFRGQEDDAGFWRGFSIHGLTTTASELHHTTIRNAGESDVHALYLDVAILVDHVTVEDNDRGVYVGPDGLDPDSTSLVITGTNEGLPLYLEPDALTSIPANSTFTGNTLDRIEILPGNYRSDGALINPGVPYYIDSGLHVANGTFVPQPGTRFVMGADAELTSAQYSSDDATFILAGTESEPIVFSGDPATPGYWHGVTVGPKVESTAKVEWVEFDGGGGSDATAMLSLSQSVPVNNCTFTNSASGGMKVPSGDDTDYAANNTFSDNVGANVIE